MTEPETIIETTEGGTMSHDEAQAYDAGRADALGEVAARVIALLEEARRNQLTTYVKNATLDVLTDDEIREHAPHYESYLANDPGRQSLASTCLGYAVAGALPTERLEAIFAADDWGAAWEVADGEDTEYFEQDEGRIEAYNDVLRLLGHGEDETT